MKKIRLILGDQLNPCHEWFSHVDESVLYVMMEVRSETDYVLHHAQKVLGIFAAMRDFARQIASNGHQIHYLKIGDPDNRQSIHGNLDDLLATGQFGSLQWQEPDEWRVDKILSSYADRPDLETGCVSSGHFLTSRSEASMVFQGKHSWLMETFYRAMRRRDHILLDGSGKPEGGRWNYDHENRKAWRGMPSLPQDWRKFHNHTCLWHEIETSGIKTLGDPDADNFCWPLHRKEAMEMLHAFITFGLPYFGDYQDAMSRHSPRLFHSLLSFALNTKMLAPSEVLGLVEDAYREGFVGLGAAEGFIRQILGWREYVRGFYWHHMPEYPQSNYFGHKRPLPGWFWNGQTRMQCLSLVIKQSLATAYAHHIQRLMVVGNFALLAGLDPYQLHQWYLGIYIDAFEWVEMPNTMGMSQYADGGQLASKPYVSSASYIHRMSDYCAGCFYDRKARYGEKACPLNALYWSFHLLHQEKLGKHPRLFQVYRYLDAIDAQEKQHILLQSKHLLEEMEQL